MAGEQKVPEGSECLKVSPPIHRLGYCGRLVRTQLMAGILRGTPVLLMIQNLRTPLLNSVMKVISFAGEEYFYVPAVAGLVWVFDAKLGRQLVLLMSLAFYVAGFLKNLLCLPRPPTPPIVPLLRCNDWALPSHHAVLSVNMAWYIWFYASLNYSLSLHVYLVVFACVSAWSSFIMFSRVYLGVHSPADILAGGAIGCVILALWLQVDDAIDGYIASGSHAALVFILVVMFLLWVHPDPQPTTIVFVETLSMVSVMLGVVVARSHASHHILYAAMERSHTYSSSLHLLACSICRFVLGVALVLVAKVTIAIVTKQLLGWLCQLLGIKCTFERRTSQVCSEKIHYSPESFLVVDKVENHVSIESQPFNVYVPVKVLSYVSIGLVTVETAPQIFHWLGI